MICSKLKLQSPGIKNMLSYITTTIFHNKVEEGKIKNLFLNHLLFSHRLFYVIVIYIYFIVVFAIK